MPTSTMYLADLAGFAVGGAIEDLGQVYGRRPGKLCHAILGAKFIDQQPQVVEPYFCDCFHCSIKSVALMMRNERTACIGLSESLILRA